MRYRATVEYDGAAYQGFQRQIGDTPTIQLALENAIAAVAGSRVNVIGAGRTDTGVHATGQVIAFDLADWKHGAEVLLRALNATLPDDIALRDLNAAPPDFHPRFSALARQYCYTVIVAAQRRPLLRAQAWCLSRVKLDLALMQQTAARLIGEHDFGAFGQPPDGRSNTIREIYLSAWTMEQVSGEQWLRYGVKATAFLQHQVRRMVGALVDVGRGRLTLAQFETGFGGRDAAMFKTLAPPQGLVLEAVFYPEQQTGRIAPILQSNTGRFPPEESE